MANPKAARISICMLQESKLLRFSTLVRRIATRQVQFFVLHNEAFTMKARDSSMAGQATIIKACSMARSIDFGKLDLLIAFWSRIDFGDAHRAILAKVSIRHEYYCSKVRTQDTS